MNKIEYDLKREQLVEQHPTVMQESWLRTTRIIIAVIFLIVVKLSQAGLPMYNISCVQDNILPYFLPLQEKLGATSQKLIEIFFLLTFLGIFIATLTHWMMKSKRAQLAIMICVFFLVKTLSDVSLVLDKPEGAIWQDFSIGFTIKAEYFFYANVDPFSGLLMIFIYYFASEEETNLKGVILTVLGIYLTLFLIFEFTFQLFFSFAVFSSILTFIFAIFISQKIEKSYFKYEPQDLTDQMVKETNEQFNINQVYLIMFKYKGLNSLKSTSSIWNMLNFFRTQQKLAANGQEIQGIVIKQGINNKTVTVRGWWRYWENKRRRIRHTANSYQVHDENNYCRVGDIVVIKQCGQMSNKKSYFVRNVVHQASRFELLNTNNLDEVVSNNFYREGQQKHKEDERFQAMLERIQHIKNLGMFDIDNNNQEKKVNINFFIMSKNLIMIFLILSIVGVIVLGYFTCLAFFMPHLLELNTHDSSILRNSRISLCVATGIYFGLMIIFSIYYKSQKDTQNDTRRQHRSMSYEKPSKYD